jgi:hypothetical protein
MVRGEDEISRGLRGRSRRQGISVRTVGVSNHLEPRRLSLLHETEPAGAAEGQPCSLASDVSVFEMFRRVDARCITQALGVPLAVGHPNG